MTTDASDRIHDWLKHFGPAKVSAICECLRLSKGKCYATLDRMRQRGEAQSDDNAPARWSCGKGKI